MCDAAGNAPKQPAPSSSASTTKGKGKVVAAIMPAEQEESEDDDRDFITAVMPSAVLGNGSFSEEDVSPPLRSKHFIMKFKIYGPRSDFALKFSVLIDNGAHVVLIRPEVINELGLKQHLLPVPEPVDIVITNGKKKKKKMLTEYVKLSVTSVDNAWTSRTVHALIAPSLCMPIILRLPFLIHNNIVTDHATHSCIDKITGYNLLHLPIILPPCPPPVKATVQIRQTKAAKKHMLEELMSVCRKRMKDGHLAFKEVKDIDMVGAI